jgi:integrating conjugative element protein (TIGR03759 family)
MFKSYLLFLALLAMQSAQNAHAEFNIPGVNTQHLNTLAAKDPTLAHAGLAVNDDDITNDQDSHSPTLTEQQLHEAKVWNLTVEEERRYVLLMQNRSGIYYRGLRQTPIDILGINARDEAERAHFAELSAAQEAQKVAKNIAWNNAFHKAHNELFSNVPVVGDFDPSPYSPYAHQPVHLNSGETLYLFTRQDEAMRTVLLTLLDAIENTPNTQLHLMLLDCDDTEIQLWANKNQIPAHLVNSGQVTLNHGEPNYKALKVTKKTTPLLLLSKNGESSVVDLGRF